MTYKEIIKAMNIRLEVCDADEQIDKVYGKDVKEKNLRAILFYGNKGWIGSKNRKINFDILFFYLVRKGKIDIPSDHDTCPKCGGSGNVGYTVDAGLCWKCHGYGYKKIKK